MSGIDGKRALVTGGSSGIGKAIAAQLVLNGAQVVVAARTPATLQAVAAEIGARAAVCDLSTPQAAQMLGNETIRMLGGLDILVMCSGIYASGASGSVPAESFAEVLANNLLGPAALANSLVPPLRESRGDILVVNSSIVRAPNIAGRAYFAAGQHALLAFTNGLRDELNEVGIRVASIFPGATATARQRRMHEAMGKPYPEKRLLQADDVARIALAALSMPDTAEVTDIHIRPRYKT